jgi:hypothetical protein
MKNVVLGVLLLLSAACAAPAASGSKSGAAVKSPEKVASTDPDTTYVCEKVRPTGSNIPEEVCRTVRQKTEERRQVQDALVRPKTYNAGNK